METVGELWEKLVVLLYRCRFLSQHRNCKVVDFVHPSRTKFVVDIPRMSDDRKTLKILATGAIFPRAVQVFRVRQEYRRWPYKGFATPDAKTTKEYFDIQTYEADVNPAKLELPFCTSGMHRFNFWVDDMLGFESTAGKPTLLLFQAKELKVPPERLLKKHTTDKIPWSIMRQVFQKFNLVYVHVTINESIADDEFNELTERMSEFKISVCTVTMEDIKSWCPTVAYSGCALYIVSSSNE
eukprot:PhF_6_TR19567/c0_g1_i5/m.28528